MFCGLSTQWPSSGKYNIFDGTFNRCKVVNRSNPCGREAEWRTYTSLRDVRAGKRVAYRSSVASISTAWPIEGSSKNSDLSPDGQGRLTRERAERRRLRCLSGERSA